MTEGDFDPTVFVVMPYGLKRDPLTGLQVDFDEIWNRAFRPAAERAQVEPIRADEERSGGFVHLAMFERLLLSEIVLADLTLMSPNVMYELGIRHATRPRATVSVFARIGQLPFDLAPIRAIPYTLGPDGHLTDSSAETLIEQLAERLNLASSDQSPDSPLFQLIRTYPGVNLPHDVTESFQKRVRSLTALSAQIRSAPIELDRAQAIASIRALSKRLNDQSGTPTELFLDVLLAYRDVEAYDDMVQLVEEFPAPIRDHPAVRQIYGFALNRRNGPGDDWRAINVLERLIKDHGVSAETFGILGRVHKQRYLNLRASDPALAQQALHEAIKAYDQGFRTDIRDYYPGVNAVTLLILEGSEASIASARQLSPAVALAVATRQGLESKDYWDVATVLELAAANLDRATATRAANRLRYIGKLRWQFNTTTKNLRLLLEAHEAKGETVDWLNLIINQLQTDPAQGN